MESHKGAAGAGGGGGGGEVRRINVVYFLSRGGRTDHPHLFRVNHLNRAGVRLRDVKRWLSDLRGKDMPDHYSWSYKRKYKGGYVWQDLKDDDLITPVSDNEYVLKGCDVRGTPPPPCSQPPKRTRSLGEKKRKEEEEELTPCNDDQNRPVEVELVLTPDSDESSPKPPPPADQDSPGGCESARRGTVPFKVEKPQGALDEQKQQEQVVIKIEVSRSQNHHQQEHEEQKEEEDEDEEEEAATEKAGDTEAAEEQPPQGAAAGGVRSHAQAQAVGKQQARTMRVARALHNLLTCARAEADDPSLRPLARRQAGDDDLPPPTPTCLGMEGCGLRVSRKTARSRKGGNDKQRRRDGEKKHDAHKPASLPRCSQCGKEFKPQELHSHMQSCRGFRERMRRSTSARPSADRGRNWTAGHYSSESERPASDSAVFLLTES